MYGWILATSRAYFTFFAFLSQFDTHVMCHAVVATCIKGFSASVTNTHVNRTDFTFKLNIREFLIRHVCLGWKDRHHTGLHHDCHKVSYRTTHRLWNNCSIVSYHIYYMMVCKIRTFFCGISHTHLYSFDIH